jgi:hypothetical protein
MSKNGIRMIWHCDTLSHRLQSVPGRIEIVIELQHFHPDILEMSPTFHGDGLQIQSR